MAVETYEGVHTTCTAIAERILEVGFLPSPANRYVGAGVYFFDKAKKGIRNAKKYRKLHQKQHKCPEGDEGALLCAEIACEEELILNLEEGEFAQPLRDKLEDFLTKWDEDLAPLIQDEQAIKTEKNLLLNTVRIEYVKGLEIIFNKTYEMIKIEMPYMTGGYGSGFVVYRTDCIGQVSFCEGERT